VGWTNIRSNERKKKPPKGKTLETWRSMTPLIKLKKELELYKQKERAEEK